MDKVQFRRELMYEATMSIYRQLLATGAITDEDYAILSEMMQKKYTPLFVTLSGKKRLTLIQNRVIDSGERRCWR